MTRFVVAALVMTLTAVAWAADVVTIEDWKTQKLGSNGIPEGWLGGQTWGLPQHDMTIEENEGHRVLHLKSKIESSTIRKEIKGKVNLKETPILEWTWKAVVLPTNADCRKKTADDQAARRHHREEREDGNRHLRRRALGPGGSGQVAHPAAQRRRRLSEDLRQPARKPRDHLDRHRLGRHVVVRGVVLRPDPLPEAVSRGARAGRRAAGTSAQRRSPTSWGTAVASSAAVASAAAAIAASSALFITLTYHWPASDSTNCTYCSSSSSERPR